MRVPYALLVQQLQTKLTYSFCECNHGQGMTDTPRFAPRWQRHPLVPAVLSDGWFSTVLFKKSKISGQCDRWIDRGLIPSKTERSKGYRKDRNIFLQLNLGNFNRF